MATPARCILFIQFAGPGPELKAWQEAVVNSTQDPAEGGKAKATKEDGRQYILRLARVLFDEGLFDRHEWLCWLIHGLDGSKFGSQRWLFLSLAGQYLEDIAASRDLTVLLHDKLLKLTAELTKLRSGSSKTAAPSAQTDDMLTTAQYLSTWINLNCQDVCVLAGPPSLQHGNTQVSQGSQQWERRQQHEGEATAAAVAAAAAAAAVSSRRLIIAELQNREPADVKLAAWLLDAIDPLADTRAFGKRPADLIAPGSGPVGTASSNSGRFKGKNPATPSATEQVSITATVVDCVIAWTLWDESITLTQGYKAAVATAFIRGYSEALGSAAERDDLRHQLLQVTAVVCRAAEEAPVRARHVALLLAELVRKGVLDHRWLSDRVTAQGGGGLCGHDGSVEQVVYAALPLWRSISSGRDRRLRRTLLNAKVGSTLVAADVDDAVDVAVAELCARIAVRLNGKGGAGPIIQIPGGRDDRRWLLLPADHGLGAPTLAECIATVVELPLSASDRVSNWLAMHLRKRVVGAVVDGTADLAVIGRHVIEVFALLRACGDTEGLVCEVLLMLDSEKVVAALGHQMLRELGHHTAYLGGCAEGDLLGAFVEPLQDCEHCLHKLHKSEASSLLFELLSVSPLPDDADLAKERAKTVKQLSQLDERHAAHFDKATGALAPPVAAAAVLAAVAAGQPIDAAVLGEQVSGVAFCATYSAVAAHLAGAPGAPLPVLGVGLTAHAEFRPGLLAAWTDAPFPGGAKQVRLAAIASVNAGWLSGYDVVGCIAPRRLRRKKPASGFIAATMAMFEHAGALFAAGSDGVGVDGAKAGGPVLASVEMHAMLAASPSGLLRRATKNKIEAAVLAPVAALWRTVHFSRSRTHAALFERSSGGAASSKARPEPRMLYLARHIFGGGLGLQGAEVPADKRPDADAAMKAVADGVIGSIFDELSPTNLGHSVLQLRLLCDEFQALNKENVTLNLIAGHVMRHLAMASRASAAVLGRGGEVVGPDLLCALMIQMSQVVRARVLEKISHSLHEPSRWWARGLPDIMAAGHAKIAADYDPNGRSAAVGAAVGNGEAEAGEQAGGSPADRAAIEMVLKVVTICLFGQDVQVNQRVLTKLQEMLGLLREKLAGAAALQGGTPSRRPEHGHGHQDPVVSSMLLGLELRVKLLMLNAAVIWNGLATDRKDSSSKRLCELGLLLLGLIQAVEARPRVAGGGGDCGDRLVMLLLDALSLILKETVTDSALFDKDPKFGGRLEEVLRRMSRSTRARCERLLPGSLGRRYKVELLWWGSIPDEKVPFCYDMASGTGEPGGGSGGRDPKRACSGDCSQRRLPIVTTMAMAGAGGGGAGTGGASRSEQAQGGVPDQQLEELVEVVAQQPYPGQGGGDKPPGSGGGGGSGGPTQISYGWFGTTLRERRRDLYHERIQHTRSLRHLTQAHQTADGLGGGVGVGSAGKTDTVTGEAPPPANPPPPRKRRRISMAPE